MSTTSSTTENANTFANGVFASFAGYGTPSGRTGGLWPLPAGAFNGTISTSGFIPGYGNGALAPGFVVYSPYAIYDALEAAGYNTEPGFDPGSVLNVEEKTLSLLHESEFRHRHRGHAIPLQRRASRGKYPPECVGDRTDHYRSDGRSRRPDVDYPHFLRIGADQRQVELLLPAAERRHEA